MTILAPLHLQTSSGMQTINLRTGAVTMITGPNGVGKSAFLYGIYRSLGAGRSDYHPGHRQIHFNNGWDNIGQDVAQLRLNNYTHVDNFNRYKSAWSEDHFKSVVRRLSQADAAYNAVQLAQIRSGAAAAGIGPLEHLNIIFESARMPVRFMSTTLGIRAVRNMLQYDIDQMSDGERAAFYISSAIITQEQFTVLIIDEPEKHLHPSISAPLISAAVRSRNDIAYVFASHDLNVIDGLQSDTLIYIRDSQITSFRPEMRNYDLQVIGNSEAIPESLRRDLLGSRQRILFVEGEPTSIDFGIYNAIFQTWKIAPKGGADTVISTVGSFERNADLHWINVSGLVDGDGRDQAERTALASKGVHVLACPTAENLLFQPVIIERVCEVMYALEGGLAAEYRIQNLRLNIKGKLMTQLPSIVSKIVAWRVNRIVSATKITTKQVSEGLKDIPGIDVGKTHEQVTAEVTSIVEDADPLQALSKLPIKNTGIPSMIAELIGIDQKRYVAIVLTQITSNTVAGARMKEAILPMLPADLIAA